MEPTPAVDVDVVVVVVKWMAALVRVPVMVYLLDVAGDDVPHLRNFVRVRAVALVAVVWTVVAELAVVAVLVVAVASVLESALEVNLFLVRSVQQLRTRLAELLMAL